jgi:transposase
MTEDLLTLADWLTAMGVTHVAMESTGVYWKPIYNLLEATFALLLVNAQHIKMVPGRKTDVKDCEWIADLLRHGLLRSSFVPDRPHRELRELVRYRTSLIQEHSAEVNRVQAVLEGANIKLAAVATDVQGVSAQAILRALLDGCTDTHAMAELAKGRMRVKIPQLERALTGSFGPHQRFLLPHLLAHLEFLEDTIARLSQEVASRMAPFEAELERLDAIPGVNRRIAEIIVAEAGTDMSQFPTAGHFASWIGLCPGNNESAGKHRSGKTRKGNKWLRAGFTEAGQAAGHTKDSYLGSQYHRLAGRRGKRRAALAVGHSIAVIAYHLLQEPDRTYTDLGSDYFLRHKRTAVMHHHVQQLRALGYRVTLDPAA